MEFIFNEYKKYAKKDSMAMLNLGICYFDGKGVKKDRNKALKCFLASVKKQNPEACKQLAKNYKSGSIGIKDSEKAEYYLNLAKEYENNIKIVRKIKLEETNTKIAIYKTRQNTKYLIKNNLLYNDGCRDLDYKIGMAYLSCDDIKNNKVLAFKCFLNGYKAKSTIAIEKLIECYEQGDLCEKDIGKAEQLKEELKELKENQQKAINELSLVDYPTPNDSKSEAFRKLHTAKSCPSCYHKIKYLSKEDIGSLEEEYVRIWKGTSPEYDKVGYKFKENSLTGQTTTKYYRCQNPECNCLFECSINRVQEDKTDGRYVTTTYTYKGIKNCSANAQNNFKALSGSFTEKY